MSESGLPAFVDAISVALNRGAGPVRHRTRNLVRSTTSVKTLPLSEVKAKLSQLVDEVESRDERVVITRKGRPAAVLVSQDELESWQETLDITSDRTLMTEIRRGIRQVVRGQTMGYERSSDRSRSERDGPHAAQSSAQPRSRERRPWRPCRPAPEDSSDGRRSARPTGDGKAAEARTRGFLVRPDRSLPGHLSLVEHSVDRSARGTARDHLRGGVSTPSAEAK